LLAFFRVVGAFFAVFRGTLVFRDLAFIADLARMRLGLFRAAGFLGRFAAVFLAFFGVFFAVD